MYTRLDEIGASVVHGLQDSVGSQTQIDSNTLVASTFLDIAGDPINRLDDARVGSTALLIETLQAEQQRLLGHAKGSTADGSSNMGAVAVEILVFFALDPRLDLFGAAFKVFVRVVNTGINDVVADTSAARIVVCVVVVLASFGSA